MTKIKAYISNVHAVSTLAGAIIGVVIGYFVNRAATDVVIEGEVNANQETD